MPFTTEGPYAAFPASLEYPGMGIAGPGSEVDEQGVISRPVGTRSFKLEKWNPAAGTVYLVRNDSYWGAKPRLEKIIMKGIPDPAPRLMAIEKGEIDFTCDVPYTDLKRPQNTSGIKLKRKLIQVDSSILPLDGGG